MKRSVIVFAAAVLVAAAAFALWPRTPLTELRARQLAQTRFEHICGEFGLSTFNYDGPIPTTVGGAQFAYEWHGKRPGVRTVLISVASEGAIVEPTFLDEGK